MKTISMANTSPNWYYTLSEYETEVKDLTISGKCTIRGIIREHIEVGDILQVNPFRGYTVLSFVCENSKGQFNNPSDAINSHVTAVCSFSRSINQ